MAKVKKTVIINKKMYKMPSWTFRDIRKLESAGLDMMKLQSPTNNVFTALTAFVSVAADVDVDEADALVEAHVENGGDIKSLLGDFYNALGASAFFARILKNLNTEVPEAENAEETE